MLEAVGHPVTRLHRSRYAGLEVENLHPGEWRELERCRSRTIESTRLEPPMTIAARIHDRKIEPIERGSLGERRQRLLSGLEGVVLELGAGTGRSLPLLRGGGRGRRSSSRTRSSASCSSSGCRRRGSQVAVVDALPEELPFPDESFDAVVIVLVLCTVDRPSSCSPRRAACSSPAGGWLLLEHVRADGPWGCFQDLTTPLHRFVSCGCAPNRRTAQAVRDAGFDLYEERFPLHGASPLGRPAIQGIALKR